MKKLKLVVQTENSDCGLACMAMIINGFGIDTSLFELKLKFPPSANGTSAKVLLDVAQFFNCEGKAIKISPNELANFAQWPHPVILHVSGNHYIVLESLKKDRVVALDPEKGRITISFRELEKLWDGVVICFTPPPQVGSADKVSKNNNLVKILKVIKTKWIIYLIAAILAIGVNLALPRLLGQVISSFVDELKDPIVIGEIIPHMLFAAAMLLFSYWFKERVSLSLQLLLDRTLTFEFVQKLLHLPLRFFHRFSTGDILNRVGSTAVLREFYTTSLASILLEGLVAIVLIVAIFVESTIVGCFVLGGSLLLFCNIAFNWKGYKHLLREQVYANAVNTEQLTEFLTGINTVKSLNKEEVFHNRWQKVYKDYLTASKISSKRQINISLVNVAFDKGLPALVLMYVLSMTYVEQLTQNKAFYIYFLVVWFTPSLLGIVRVMLSAIHLSLHAERLGEFDGFVFKGDDAKTPMPEHDNSQYRIYLKNVSYQYDTEAPYLFDNMSIAFEKPGLHFITGASGSGKSTLLKMIANELNVDKGRVFIESETNGNIEVYEESREICFLGQNPYIFRGSIIDNLTFFSADEYSDEQIVAACKKAGIHEEICAMRHGYQTLLQSSGENISGGQCQRLALARLLLMNPPILILDEVTNSLNTELEQHIVEMLRTRKGMTIFATHKLSFIEAQDHIYEIANQTIQQIDYGTISKKIHKQER